MLLAADVHYSDEGATAAAVAFTDWGSAAPSKSWVLRFSGQPAPYEPGKFYKRELPFLLSVVERARSEFDLDAVVVDGHVWLALGQPGLGKYLFESLGRTVPVVGIAKSAYYGGAAAPICRGQSRRPLFVSSVGIEEAEAVRLVAGMHGDGRLPTIVRVVDRLARNGEAAAETLPELGVGEKPNGG